MNKSALSKNQSFTYFGEFDSISEKSFHEKHREEYSMTIRPNEIIKKYQIFRLNNWWDKRSNDYSFEFDTNDTFQITIDYFVSSANKKYENSLATISMPDAIELLTPYNQSGRYWDSHPIYG